MSNLKSLFGEFSEENLIQIAKHEKMDREKKKKLVENISVVVADLGVNQLTNLMSLVDLKEISDAFPDSKKLHPADKAPSKTMMKKHYAQEILDTGVEKFLDAQDEDFIIKMIKVAGFDPIASASKRQLISQLVSLIGLLGAETFLSRFEVPLLKSLMDDMKLSCDTDSKVAIVEAITQHKDAKSTAPEKPKYITFSKKKPEIEFGVTYQDLFQHYFVDELRDYCRDNDLKISGNKPDLIKRIIASLEEEKENSSSKSKSKTTKKKEESKESDKKVEDSKKKETTKEKEKEKEESEEEEEKVTVEKSKSKSKSKKVDESKKKKEKVESDSEDNEKEKEKEMEMEMEKGLEKEKEKKEVEKEELKKKEVEELKKKEVEKEELKKKEVVEKEKVKESKREILEDEDEEESSQKKVEQEVV